MLPKKPSERLRLLRWIVPLALAVLVAVYQLVLVRWLRGSFGEDFHFWSEMLIYGIGGPLLAFLVLDYLGRWQEERETSELQAKLLEETRKRLSISHGLSDEALQTLYAISILLDSLKTSLPEVTPEAASMLHETEQALEAAMLKIRNHLQTSGKTPPTNGKTICRAQEKA